MAPNKRANTIGYIALPLSLTGVVVQALNTPYTRYTFFLFLISASLWLANGIMTKNRPMALMQSALVALNVVAIWRWF